MNEPEPVLASAQIGAPLAHVFDVFTRELGSWWPRDYTFSGDRLAAAGIDHLRGGSWFEVDAAGDRVEWGEVLSWEPPERIVLSWRVGLDRTQTDPSEASEVEFTFRSLAPALTEVSVEHRRFGRHGAGADSMREGMASDQGWSRILSGLSRAASQPDPGPDDGHQIL